MKTGRLNIRWWVIIPALLLTALVFGGDDSGQEVQVSLPDITSISESIPANGKVRPIAEVKISPDVSGEIVELFCQEGETVCKGDLLLKIKPDLYLSILDQATATLNMANARYKEQESTLRLAQLVLQRDSALLAHRAIPLSEFEEAQAQYDIALQGLEAAAYNIQSAVASVREAEENLAKTTVYSPMDGVISRLWVEKGERVVGTSQMAGTEMLRIADQSRMEIVTEIGENDISKIDVGDTASVTIDAFPAISYKGVVTHIGHSAKNLGYSLDQITSFEVEILITGDTGMLKPGMSSSIKIETEKKDGIIAVPLQCINPNGCIFVVAEDGTSVRERKVRFGIQDTYRIEVTDGLDSGEEIVVSPYEAIHKTLKDYDKVYIDRDKH